MRVVDGIASCCWEFCKVEPDIWLLYLGVSDACKYKYRINKYEYGKKSIRMTRLEMT